MYNSGGSLAQYYTYDLAGLVTNTEIQINGNPTINPISSTYRLDGNKVTETETTGGSVVDRTYVYDDQKPMFITVRHISKTMNI